MALRGEELCSICGDVHIVFETHAISEDNELGVASGWSHSRLSDLGRRQARNLGERRRDDGIATVFSSDLRRAAETADLAFASGTPPILLDWRLRECDYGERNGDPAEAHGRDRAAHVDEPFPGGEAVILTDRAQRGGSDRAHTG